MAPMSRRSTLRSCAGPRSRSGSARIRTSSTRSTSSPMPELFYAPHRVRPDGFVDVVAALADLPYDWNEGLFALGVDLGYNDPFAMVLNSWHPNDPNLYEVCAWKQSGLDSDAQNEAIKAVRSHVAIERSTRTPAASASRSSRAGARSGSIATTCPSSRPRSSTSRPRSMCIMPTWLVGAASSAKAHR